MISSSSRLATRLAASVRPTVAVSSQSTSMLRMTQTRGFLSGVNLSAGLPNFKGVHSGTTLGELYDRAYTKYQYRIMYPVLAWVGFLWYNLWIPYTPADVKQKQFERMEKLKALEFSQSP
eukprot:jgi/Hompol1/2477/HPOL_000096-RA